MSRRYVIEHRKGRDVVWAATLPTAEEAAFRFIDALQEDGHDEMEVRAALHGWTLALMQGATGYSRMTPDLGAVTSIQIITTKG